MACAVSTAAAPASAATGDENLAEADGLRLREFGFVVVVIFLDLSVGERNLAADFLLHDVLGDAVVADAGLEILIRNALLLRGLFEVFHGVKMVLLADFIELLDELGLAGDVEVLAFGDEQLLINLVAQHVLLAGINLVLRSAGGVHFLLDAGLRADDVGAGDDLVIDARDHIFHHRRIGGVRSGSRRQSNLGCDRNRCQQAGGKKFLKIHQNPSSLMQQKYGTQRSPGHLPGSCLVGNFRYLPFYLSEGIPSTHSKENDSRRPAGGGNLLPCRTITMRTWISNASARNPPW